MREVYGQYYDGQKTNRKHVLKNVIGSRYYHKTMFIQLSTEKRPD